MKNRKTHDRKSSTFDSFIAARGAATERLVMSAARTVDAYKYRNITEYCKTLAKIIGQLREAEAQSTASPFHSGKCKNFSHVTLLRNESYRQIVEQAFNVSRSNSMTDDVIEEDLEVLKAINAGLVAQVTLLKAKIISLDSCQEDGGSRGGIGEYEEGGAIIDELNQKLFLILKLFQLLRLNTIKAVRIIEVPTDAHEAGLHGVLGLIATSTELDQLELILDSLPTELRKQLNAILRSAEFQRS
ncbi:hypothetical protein BWR59_19635 [Pseudomonas sp. Bc-h]|uniref:hypothetical protein n=1 Tax=Pseudomonas sp. Bc-h TaxID=1943632 RepID=UPI0009DB6CAB|nr:hypothetical protein [Pseudomonas sp. Bc-h]OQR29680.1 hypothetical protein BWR59_19635 [Pseudomonas sp. Bc-h]